MEENEQDKKSQYINDNIISKGYNPEDLSNYIMNETGKSINDMKFNDLKQMINNFKNKGLVDIYQTVKEKQPIIDKPENIIDTLYSTEIYTISTKTPKDNKLLQFEKNQTENKKKLTIKVKDPKKESGGFFGKSKITYEVECPELNFKVRRTYEDFEWLREELARFYPLRIITPLIKEEKLIINGFLDKNDNENISNQKKTNYLNKFCNELLNRKLFRTSNLLCNFLELNENEFKKFKEKVNKNKYELSVNFDNLKNMSGKINCDINKEKITKAEKFNLKFSNIKEIYSNIILKINEINTDYKNLSIHMKDLSNCFLQLSDKMKLSQNKEKISDFLAQLNIIFSGLSQSYERQTELFNQDFYGIFLFFKSEIKEINNIYDQFIDLKNKYETKGVKLYKKKEELFNTRDYKNWGLKPEMESHLINFQNDRKLAYDQMLYKESEAISIEKKQLACYIYFMYKQYDKFYKLQNEAIKNFFVQFKEKTNIVNGYSAGLMKLFNF